MARAMLGVSLMDDNKNEVILQRTRQYYSPNTGYIQEDIYARADDDENQLIVRNIVKEGLNCNKHPIKKQFIPAAPKSRWMDGRKAEFW